MTHSRTNNRFLPAIAVAIILILSAFNSDHTSDLSSICKYALIDDPAGLGESIVEESVPYLPLADMILRF